MIPILLHVEIEALTAASLGLDGVGFTGAARALFACIRFALLAHFAALVIANPQKKKPRANTCYLIVLRVMNLCLLKA